MNRDWVKIFEATNPVEASIVLTMLEDNGISAVEMNKRDSSYLNFGTIDIYCPQNEVLTALNLIRKNKT